MMWVADKKSRIRLGKILFVFSTAVWILGLALLVVRPEIKGVIWIGVVLIVISDITFYISAILLGTELIRKYGKYLDPRKWFK
ncbi:MAG: hypothetical protein MSIBF_07275 [Candidatus Altiarchaeales archaeon IMC4]|nr:MAG: hypothetical protein MSIBF_07275 [Candidatus Altiarchaeales archaeon IMC4]